MIAARQIFLGLGGAKLPYDTEVEYLESTGAQYIDTGYTLNTDTDVLSIVYQNTSTQTHKWLWGSYEENARVGCSSATVSAPTVWYKGHIPVEKDAQYNSPHTLIFDAHGVSNDGVVLSSFKSFVGTYNLYLYALNLDNSGAPSSYFGYGRIYGYEHRRNGILVRDFIPVRVGGVGCMYDRVSGQLFRNQGTGAFLYGPDKIPIETDRYVQDGLVAMWDGKENAGVGLHDPDATVWKDLVGDLDIIVPSSDSFASDHLVHVSGTPQSENDTRICEGTNLTVESVFEASSDRTISTCNTQAGSGTTSNGSGFAQYSLRYQAAGNPSYSRFSRGNGTSWGYSRYSSIPTPIGEICSLVDVVDFDVANNKYSYKYVNGQLDSKYPFRNGPVGYTVTGKMRVFMDQPYHGYCLRIYNRALTAAEIAANYAIDKERFNLP